MDKNSDNKLVTVVIRIPKYKKEMIEKTATKRGLFEADIIRSGIEKELNLQMYKDSLDVIIKELDKLIDQKLDPFIKAQRKLSVKNLRTNVINTYLMGEFFSKILGDQMHDEFLTILANARKKANYYITRDTKDMRQQDLYDFYAIGEMYRNE